MPTKTETNEMTRQFESLLRQYGELRSSEMMRATKILNEFLPAFLEERKKWSLGQRKSAEDFNLFEVMGVDGNEVIHSKILAWALDQRIERGTHAQGNLGFRIFLEELSRELHDVAGGHVIAYADDPHYWVHTEVSGYEARVDIEIAARNKFLIHLETLLSR